MASKDIAINFANGKSDKLPIKTFNLNQFVDDPAIIMIAKRGSGKSWVVRGILEYYKDIPVGMIISPTDRMSSFYGKFFPDTFIFYEYKSEIMERILNRQMDFIDKAKKKLKEGKKLDPRAFLIMDDCLGQKGSWVRDKPIQELLFNGRHYKLMYILTMQFPLGITPELRCNFDYIFLLATDFISDKKRIYDHYAGMFPTFDSFRQVFDQLTDDYGSMVIVNRGVKKTLFEKIYWYKAPDLDELTTVNIGCKQFRNYHKDNYNPDWKITARKMNPEEFMIKKKHNKSLIQVDKLDSKNTFYFDKKKKK